MMFAVTDRSVGRPRRMLNYVGAGGADADLKVAITAAQSREVMPLLAAV